MPLDLKVIYLVCSLKLCCINDTSNLATEALHSPTFFLTKWASAKNKWVWQGIATISDNQQLCKEHIIAYCDVWRISRWIISACPSLISGKNCWSHYEHILPGVSHCVSAQEDVWFGRWWCLKNSKMIVKCWALFDIEMELFQHFWYSICCYLPSKFCSRGYMVWKTMMFEEIQDGCLVLGNLWYATWMILAISESPCCLKPSINFLLK